MPNYFEIHHKYRSYGPDKVSFCQFYHLTCKCDFDLNVVEQMFQMTLLLVKENDCANLFRNPCINIQVMARTSAIYDHFII